jgi:hypothetical protein
VSAAWKILMEPTNTLTTSVPESLLSNTSPQ